MNAFKIPAEQRSRLEALFENRGHQTAQSFASHLVVRALGLPEPSAPAVVRATLEARTEQDGYSTVEELVEHLIERGLQAYETPETDPARLEERLRGLGYID
jgi:hypothetical protein